MAFSVGLLLKGLAGLGAASGAVSLGVIYGVDWDPHLLKLSFEERLKQKVGDFFGNKSSDKLCKKQDSSDQNKNEDPERYTCDAQTKGKELKEKLKFTTDGENELEIKNETLTGQKIEIRQNKDTKNFPYEIMLVLENVISPITLQEESGTKKEVTFKQKTNPEFKLENGKFKHAWTIENLGEKVGLECKKEGEGTQKTCTLKPGKTINVFESSSQKEKGVTFTGELKYVEDQAEHNQGFKITVASDINLTKDGNNTNLKLLASQSYEIKASESENYTWYLAKKGCLA